jgi:hypothetical protein
MRYLAWSDSDWQRSRMAIAREGKSGDLLVYWVSVLQDEEL